MRRAGDMNRFEVGWTIRWT